MVLRFQGERDEIDRTAKEERGSISRYLFGFVFLAAVIGVTSWLSGESLPSYEATIGAVAAILVVSWIVSPFYQEFRIRTKEILGTVTEIEKAVSAVREDQKELLERLSAVEEELRSLREEN